MSSISLQSRRLFEVSMAATTGECSTVVARLSGVCGGDCIEVSVDVDDRLEVEDSRCIAFNIFGWYYSQVRSSWTVQNQDLEEV